jgi:hypothetical protein
MSILTTIVSKLRAISPELEDVIAVLQVIQSATTLGGTSASTGLAVVAAALKSLEDHAAGAITHEQLLSQIAQAQQDLAADRQLEDAELEAKFAAPGAA